jgi:hypothetical protein
VLLIGAAGILIDNDDHRPGRLLDEGHRRRDGARRLFRVAPRHEHATDRVSRTAAWGHEVDRAPALEEHRLEQGVPFRRTVPVIRPARHEQVGATRFGSGTVRELTGRGVDPADFVWN